MSKLIGGREDWRSLADFKPDGIVCCLRRLTSILAISRDNDAKRENNGNYDSHLPLTARFSTSAGATVLFESKGRARRPEKSGDGEHGQVLRRPWQLCPSAGIGGQARFATA